MEKDENHPIKPVTENEYRIMVKRMIRYSTAKHSHDPLEPVAVSPTQLVIDLFDREDIQRSSFFTYRSALLWYLGGQRDVNHYEAGYQKLLELTKDPMVNKLPKKKRVRKTINEDDLQTLLGELSNSSYKLSNDSPRWAYRAMYWLNAGLATGLRPGEWESAVWTDGTQTILHVTNGKQKLSAPAFLRNRDYDDGAEEPQEFGFQDFETDSFDTDEGDGEFEKRGVLKTPAKERKIPVESASQFYVNHHMELLKELLGEGWSFKDYYKQCRRAIWRACRKLWNGKKSYYLYTMRSQFSANTKAAVGPQETARLMGHSRLDSPSAAHYGKGNQAHKRFIGEQAKLAPTERLKISKRRKEL